MKMIKEIHLVFENCDIIFLDMDQDDILYISASGITESIRNSGGQIYRMKVAEIMQLVIPLSIMAEKTKMGTNLLDKLLMRDIASIVLHFEGGVEEQIYNIWDEDEQNSDSTNDYQHNEFLENCVVVNINNKYPGGKNED